MLPNYPSRQIWKYQPNLFIQIRPFFRLLELRLDLPELCQVERRDLLRLFDLLLVGLDLVLQFVHQLLHPLVVLVVLILLEAELLDPALKAAVVLLSLHQAALFVVQLGLKLLEKALNARGAGLPIGWCNSSRFKS